MTSPTGADGVDGTSLKGVDINGKLAAVNTDTNGTKIFDDPFADQRDKGTGLFGQNENEKLASSSASPIDRRKSSDEWDASKTPPSRFQHRKGSLYATPGSRDGHVDKNYDRDAKFHEVHDKKYGGGKRTSSSSKSGDAEK